jgi:DNA-binding LacI/PurR family transcriptional regulator
MDQRSEEIGIAAGKLVLERMRGVQRAPEHTIVEATFIDGDSVRKLSEKR